VTAGIGQRRDGIVVEREADVRNRDAVLLHLLRVEGAQHALRRPDPVHERDVLVDRLAIELGADAAGLISTNSVAESSRAPGISSL
jgi:hypothetical protein